MKGKVVLKIIVIILINSIFLQSCVSNQKTEVLYTQGVNDEECSADQHLKKISQFYRPVAAIEPVGLSLYMQENPESQVTFFGEWQTGCRTAKDHPGLTTVQWKLYFEDDNNKTYTVVTVLDAESPPFDQIGDKDYFFVIAEGHPEIVRQNDIVGFIRKNGEIVCYRDYSFPKADWQKLYRKIENAFLDRDRVEYPDECTPIFGPIS
jgi:hypothetical protein